MAWADRRETGSAAPSRKMAMLTGVSKRAIRTYQVPMVDERGRVSLYFRIRYVGFKSKKWRAGLPADHALYILREDALERIGDDAIDSVPMSNMGKDAQEIAAGWRALEAVEEGYRANAIVQHRIIWNLPHDLTAVERRALVEDFCQRTFGRLGLPWVAAIHTPDAKGDQRNFHAHICFSVRPCERTGDHEWSIAQEKVNGLTDPDGLKLMRALAAAHMNRACRAAGRRERFTHQTYKERGIDAQRQAHVGAAAMAAHERGEHVHAIARNAVIAESNELAIEKVRVEREVQAHARLTGLLERQIQVADLRAHAAAITARTKVIATSAREMIERVRRAKAVARPVAPQAVLKIRDHAQAILRRIQQRRVVHRPSPAVRNTAMTLAVTARTVAERIGTVPAPIIPSRTALMQPRRVATIVAGRTTSAVLHQKLTEQRAAAAAIHQRLVARDRQHAHEQARRLILTAEPTPYRREHNRLILDLSAMPMAARQMIESLPHDDLGRALRERHRLDQQRAAEQRKAADAAAKRVEAEHAAEAARRTLVEEACRILRDAEPRPYRRNGKRIEPDWSVLPPRERDTVTAVGIGDDDLRRALLERVRHDDRADRTTAMLDTIERERRPVPTIDGRRQVDAHTLATFGLRDDDVQTERVQRQLEDIAAQQLGEHGMIASYATAHPDQLVRSDAGWSLVPAAPAVMRELVEAWRHDDKVQRILGMLAERTGTDVVTAAKPVLTMTDTPTGEARQTGVQDAPASNSPPAIVEKRRSTRRAARISRNLSASCGW
ncbi:MobA/MobL family protein [Sphingomonas sp. SORGH_AS_0879]|uniref:MobA/MobL family protein n=1 Tax=Sphingomonas sp. SORGH_AS_0879 TaxID=3041790 RepID=UPI0027D868BE|nr:MobA/MobL family protein [Sphingomonas sp. SORGH_AS_0879]